MGRKKKDRSDKIIIGFEGTLPLKVRLEEEAEKDHSGEGGPYIIVAHCKSCGCIDGYHMEECID